MRQIVYIVIILCLLLACGERGDYREVLSRAESIMNERPDSALQILDSLRQYEAEFGHHFRMQYLLHRTNAQSKTNVFFTSDSLVSELAEYFDSHGTTNERVLAHYLLGLALSDVGEAPRAISSFQDAIAIADTLSNDFNYATLVCVYSQMAQVYHTQLLLTNEIEARKTASHYAIRANQIQWALYNQAMSAGTYILLNKKDSAEIILKSVLEQYREHGYTQEALRYSRALMHLYVEQPDKLTEAKQLMDQFESESDLFDMNHELPSSQRVFYYYKGRYFEGINRLDSAEYYYRKIYRPNMSFAAQDPMYRGLLGVYSKLHLADSIAKYAQLFCMVNDSSIAVKDQEIVAQMTASYNYNRSQKEAERERLKAKDAFILLGIIIFVAFILLLIIFAISWLFRRNQKEKKKKIARLEETLNSAMLQRSAVQDELRKLKEKDYEGIIAEKERQEEELTQTIKRLQNNLTSQEANALIEASPVYQRLHAKAGGCAELTDSEWQAIEKLVKTALPGFYSLITSRQYSIRQEGRKLCFLLRLHVGLKEASVLMGVSQPNISKLSKNILSRVFGEEGSGKELIRRLEYIF